MTDGIIYHLQDPFYAFLSEHEHALQQGEHSPLLLQEFCSTVWNFYKKNRRDFAWRNSDNPYHIVVSEIMLQQTQTVRVKEMYETFITELPTFTALADATTADVLKLWVGLGYNRRALALQGIAQKVVHEHGGILPNDPQVLQTFKGLGPATAASIVAFAYNTPTVFIETNIRSVFLHAFFQHRARLIEDKQLVPLVEKTVCSTNAREWYYALMDCGVLLKKLYKNPSRKSTHHARQSKFEGSDRQIRGAVVRLLTEKERAGFGDFQGLGYAQERLEKVLGDLCHEGILKHKEGFYFL